MPCSSPRSSGCRATDWILEPQMLPMPAPAPRAPGCRPPDWITEPKMLPMPTPAPSAPRPTPRARPIAFPAFVTSPDVAARSVCTFPSLMLRLDRRADVDGGQGGEDERLDPD